MGLQRLQHSLVTDHQLVPELYYVFWLSSIAQLCSFLQWFCVSIRNIASEALGEGAQPLLSALPRPPGGRFQLQPRRGHRPRQFQAVGSGSHPQFSQFRCWGLEVNSRVSGVGWVRDPLLWRGLQLGALRFTW